MLTPERALHLAGSGPETPQCTEWPLHWRMTRWGLFLGWSLRGCSLCADGCRCVHTGAHEHFRSTNGGFTVFYILSFPRAHGDCFASHEGGISSLRTPFSTNRSLTGSSSCWWTLRLFLASRDKIPRVMLVYRSENPWLSAAASVW